MTSRVRWLVGSTASANVADGFVALAVPLLAIRLTDDPFVISLASVAGMLPWLVLSVPAGAVLDRIDRSTTLAVANLVRTVGLLTLAVVVGADAMGIVVLYGAVIILGAFEMVADNAASSLVPSVAGRDDLDRANSWVHSSQLVAQNFVAVPAAAALFAVLAWAPFAVACIGYAAATVVALQLRRRLAPDEPVAVHPDPSDAGHRADGLMTTVRQGWDFVLEDAPVRRLIACSAAIAGSASLAQATMMLYLLSELQVPEALVGLLSTGLTIGGLAGMRLSVYLTRQAGRRRAAIAGVLILAAGLAAAFAAPSGAVAALALIAMACGAALWNIAAASARQALTPDRMLGRVLGATSLLLSATQIVGALAGGLIARIDLRAPFLVGAVLCLGLIPFLIRTRFDADQAIPTRPPAREEV